MTEITINWKRQYRQMLGSRDHWYREYADRNKELDSTNEEIGRLQEELDKQLVYTENNEGEFLEYREETEKLLQEYRDALVDTDTKRENENKAMVMLVQEKEKERLALQANLEEANLQSSRWYKRFAKERHNWVALDKKVSEQAVEIFNLTQQDAPQSDQDEEIKDLEHIQTTLLGEIAELRGRHDILRANFDDELKKREESSKQWFNAYNNAKSVYAQAKKSLLGVNSDLVNQVQHERSEKKQYKTDFHAQVDKTGELDRELHNAWKSNKEHREEIAKLQKQNAQLEHHYKEVVKNNAQVPDLTEHHQMLLDKLNLIKIAAEQRNEIGLGYAISQIQHLVHEALDGDNPLNLTYGPDPTR
ncbi:MAG: hypothetical protein DRI46_12375 [Chloroflexi bacterium]|nr:MAG: hypothetical protein DRI46_12375 [Chloroflexota bacterium]